MEGLNEEEVFHLGGSRSDSALLRLIIIRIAVGAIPIVFDERAPDVHVWFPYPFLFSVKALCEVTTGAILIFEVEDHCDALVVVWGYDFGEIYSSGLARPLFVFFYGFLGIPHL